MSANRIIDTIVKRLLVRSFDADVSRDGEAGDRVCMGAGADCDTCARRLSIVLDDDDDEVMSRLCGHFCSSLAN